MSPISSWEPSELDRQTQIAQQALARVAELEAENAGLRSHQACTKRAEQAEAALAEMHERYTHRWTQAYEGIETQYEVELVPKPELDTALAALAERDRMLRLAAEDRWAPGLNRNPDEWIAELRARAEEGSE